MTAPDEIERIEKLYRRYSAKMLRVAAVSFNNNYAVAEDAVSETFLIACRKPQSVIQHPNPEAWLMTVMHRVISHAKRDRARHRALLAGILPLVREDTTEARMQMDALYPGLREMPEFKLVKQFAVDGYSVSEIAHSLGISISACKKRLERSRKVLAAVLEGK